ncbi:MAG TPA: DUF6350 family protein [Nocardioidaceae bacterium]|jgi:hypothetical protein
MTDLLTRRSTGRGPTGPGVARRSPAFAATLAGLLASGGVLFGCMVVALTGWFSADAGAHGETTDALRVGADAWLLAHGSSLELPEATVTVVPLALTLLCGYVAYRLGRWAAADAAVHDLPAAVTGTTVLAGVYGVVAVLTAVLASTEVAQPHLGRAFVGGFVLAFAAGGSGIASRGGLGRVWAARVPAPARVVLVGSLSVVRLVWVASFAVMLVALLLDLGAAANVLAQLHTDVAGGLLYTLVVASVLPNAALLTTAYLVGPGFAVGAGTLVSPSVVVLGPVPAFPLLAALPDEGPAPWWAQALVGVPVLLAAAAAATTLRRYPVPEYPAGAACGAGAGVVGGLLLGLLCSVAGGSVGPGRMADVGADLLSVAPMAMLATGVGGLVGGLVTTWWLRRHTASE